MKNLANCKPTEFMRQTVKIRKAVEKWLIDTDIENIRKRLPTLQKPTPGMAEEERKALIAENARKAREQVNKNLSDIFDSAFEAHPEETLEVLALCCFIEPEEADDHPVSDYLDSLNELINNQSVLDFFISLVQLGQTPISTVSRA